MGILFDYFNFQFFLLTKFNFDTIVLKIIMPIPEFLTKEN